MTLSWLALSIGMAAIWSLVILSIIAFVRLAGDPGPRDPESSGDILERRLARGEIAPADYELLRELISEAGRLHSHA